LDLVGRDLPGAGLEIDVEIDARHQRAQRRVIADFADRIDLIDRLHRRRDQRLIDAFGRRAVEFDDVAVARNVDARRRQIEEHPAVRTEAAVVDDHDIAPIAITPQAADEMPLRIGLVDDAHAVRAGHDTDRQIAAMLLVYRARADREAISLAVPDDRAVALAHDRAIALADDGAIAFTRLVPLLLEVAQCSRRRFARLAYEPACINRLL